MIRATQVGFLGGVAALTLTGVGYGQTGTAEMDELQARLAAAEARIAELQSTDNDQWLTEARAEEIRGLVYDVLADADTRSSLLQGGATAGYQDGFVINSTDGNFMLKMNGLLQARWMINSQDDNGAEDGDTTRSGFEMSRAWLSFSGHVVNPQWTYQLSFDVGDTLGGTDANLVDGTIRYDYGNGFWAQMGQYASPYMRESLVGEAHQQAVDRSYLNALFNTGAQNVTAAGVSLAVVERTQGIMMGYDQDEWRVRWNYNDGLSSLNTPSMLENTEYSFGGRFEWKIEGNWEQFNDFTSPMGEEQGMMLGLAVNTQKQEYGTATTDDELEQFNATVDFSWEGGGWNLFGAFVYSNLDDDDTIDSDAFGFLAQGGYYLSEDFEIFARYEYIDLDTDLLATDDFNIITVGFNKYWSGHQVKWTTDFGFAADALPAASTDRGWREDQNDEDGQWNIRSQLQLMF
jgi:hypothetical protein